MVLNQFLNFTDEIIPHLSVVIGGKFFIYVDHRFRHIRFVLCVMYYNFGFCKSVNSSLLFWLPRYCLCRKHILFLLQPLGNFQLFLILNYLLDPLHTYVVTATFSCDMSEQQLCNLKIFKTSKKSLALKNQKT